MNKQIILELEQYLQTYRVVDASIIHENRSSVSNAIPLPPAPLQQREKILENSINLREEASHPDKLGISGILKLSKKNAAKIQENDIEEFIRKTKVEDTFSTRLLKYIDQSGVSDSQIYRKAGLDRKHFSKIRCDVNYRPKKSTALALCLALELDLERMEELLELAGYSLSNSDTGDLIVKFCVEKGIYDLMDVNEAFVYFGVKAIGVI